ncbi:octopamine receptor beta-1R-like [Oculina patagonica]
MVFPQVTAVFRAIFNVIGLPGNLLVVVTILLERRFHVMRYVLLASLAGSDFLFLILTNSFRIASIAQERWLYGQTMCFLEASFTRYFYLNTVLHLIAVSYERYSAIVKSPLTYDGTITKFKVVLIAFIWVVPIPITIGPFFDSGHYVYNPELFYCEQGWWGQSVSIPELLKIFTALILFAVPFLIITFLNWRVFKTAQILQRNTVAVQVETTSGSESQQQETTRRMRKEKKAAVDVGIILAAFLLCYLPVWITGLCRQFGKNMEVPAEVVQSTSSIFTVSSLCNPIIYSIRKREFRAGIKNVLGRMGVCGISGNINDIAIHANADSRRQANLDTEAWTSRIAQQNSPSTFRIEEIVEAREELE